MANIYKGPFVQGQINELDALNGTWMFWKEDRGESYVYYAYNAEWTDKGSRIIVQDFIPFIELLVKEYGVKYLREEEPSDEDAGNVYPPGLIPIDRSLIDPAQMKRPLKNETVEVQGEVEDEGISDDDLISYLHPYKEVRYVNLEEDEPLDDE